MKGLAKLIEHLKLFEANRGGGINCSPEERIAYAEAIAKCFMPCAQRILSGYFKVSSKERKIVRIIQPTAIELYYHEEGEGGFKDPIMYHTNDGMLAKRARYMSKRNTKEVPYFPRGSFNPHASGIDITFENPQKQYRASCLIREYIYLEGEVSELIVNSQDLYEDLLINGILLGDGDGIEWCDGKMLEEEKILRGWRKNVADYDIVDPKNPLSWKKIEGVNGMAGTYTSGKNTFVKCPFNWQFKIKD